LEIWADVRLWSLRAFGEFRIERVRLAWVRGLEIALDYGELADLWVYGALGSEGLRGGERDWRFGQM